MTLERKLKIALDESRLLILGAQVLFGFQFNGIFQELFDELPRLSRALAAAGLTLLMATIGLLVAPSMQHRIAEQGQDSPRVLAIGTISVVWALLPLCPSRSPSMCSSRWTASPGRRGERGLARGFSCSRCCSGSARRLLRNEGNSPWPGQNRQSRPRLKPR